MPHMWTSTKIVISWILQTLANCLFCGPAPLHQMVARGRATCQAALVANQQWGEEGERCCVTGSPCGQSVVRSGATGAPWLIRGLLLSACKVTTGSHVLPAKSGDSCLKFSRSLHIQNSYFCIYWGLLQFMLLTGPLYDL